MKNYLTFDEWLDVIEQMSHQQGLYQWLYEEVMSLDDDEMDELAYEIEEAKFEDAVDFFLSWEYGMYQIPIIEG